MSTEEQSINSSQAKQQRITDIKSLLSKYPKLTSAKEVCKAYSKEFPHNSPIPLPSMSRYLASSDFETYNGVYRAALKDDAEKKSQTLSNLLHDANAQVIDDYDILFISLDNDFSTTIAHYLENHTPLSNSVLGIIPYQQSLMIFCRPGSKQLIEFTIKDLKRKHS